MLYHAEKSVGLHPRLTAFNLYLLAKSKYDWKITDGYRSIAEQDGLYAIGRADESPHTVTEAKGGESAHNFRLAEDVYPTVDNGKSIVLDYSHPAWIEKTNLVESFNGLGLGKLQTNIRLSSGTDYPHVQVYEWEKHKDWLLIVGAACVALVGICLAVGTR